VQKFSCARALGYAAFRHLHHVLGHDPSFGFRHHDICLVKHHKLTMDNHSILHFSLALPDAAAFDEVRGHARARGFPSEGAGCSPLQNRSSVRSVSKPDKH
jgi:hypothetical protein